jgi:hypothetical protein
MTHIKYNPSAYGTGIFVLDPLKARFQKGTKQKSQRRGAPGIVFAGVVLIWITQVIHRAKL